MKIVVDLDSVRETAGLLAGVADEYEAIASSLRHRHGLEGVTGPHRHSVFATLDWTSSRLTSVANAHRRSAADLRMRVERASERRTSPVYAGVAMAASPGIDTAAVALDRDGDGVTDAYAMDRDGDGRHETFVADTDRDGRFDTAFEMDETGELRAASFDADGDGHAEGFLAVTGSGVVRLTDSDLDGYHEKMSWDSPTAANQPTIMASPRPGFDVVVDPNARSTTPLSVTIGANRSVNSTWSTTIDPMATSRLEVTLGIHNESPTMMSSGPRVIHETTWPASSAVTVDTSREPIFEIDPNASPTPHRTQIWNSSMGYAETVSLFQATMGSQSQVNPLNHPIINPYEVPQIARPDFDPVPIENPNFSRTIDYDNDGTPNRWDPDRDNWRIF